MLLIKHPIFLALVSAFSTSLLGYLINQLPEVPNKSENYRWIILAVAIVTAIVWIIGVRINQQPSPKPQKIANSENAPIESDSQMPETGDQKSVRQYNNYGRDQINIENIKGNPKIGGS